MEDVKTCPFCETAFRTEEIKEHISIVHFCGMKPQNVQGIMGDLLANPGLDHIVRHISSFLDAPNLAQCRLVCHAWKVMIDDHRQWLSFQLEHIQSTKKEFKNFDEPVEKCTTYFRKVSQMDTSGERIF